MSKVDLRVDWCSYKAAKWAVEHWHYSKSLPYSGKLLKLGVWEFGDFIGCVLFSWGANKNIGRPYGLGQKEICELVRIAMREHEVKVSKVISLSIKRLKRQSPGVRLIVSYADTDQSHYGGIYQASNWIYTGLSVGTRLYKVNGRNMHRRMASQVLGSVAGLSSIETGKKHKYLYPLDRAMRKQIAHLSQPYPKRADEVL